MPSEDYSFPSSRSYLKLGTLLALACGILLTSEPAAVAANGQQRTFVDSTGRQVTVPARIERIYAAGPPAAILLYTLAPDKLIGWNREPRAAEKEFMPPRYAALPVLGRLTGRGNTANVEVVLKARPDIILDYGSVSPTYVSLAERIQEQTGVPYLLLNGAFAKSAETYRLLGELLGLKKRAALLAAYAEQTFAEVAALRRRVANSQPRVYYGRGPDGLETGLGGSINVELLELVGAVNVAAEGAGQGGLARVSIEQVLKWNPEVVLTLDHHFYDAIFTDPFWQNVDAVKKGRVYLAPSEPFGWFDRPPSVNRLMGVKWLISVLYPQQAQTDLRATTREFYRLFYHVDLDDGQLQRLLEHAGHGAR